MGNWTPITPIGGGLIHATSLTESDRTMCGKACTGWKVATNILSCEGCKSHLNGSKQRKRKKA